VIVVDCGGADRGMCWGGTSTLAAELKRLAGCVPNGSVRDLAEIEAKRFPIFATGTSLRAGLRGHSGWIDIPVSVGEVLVNPGDIVIGDIDGVACLSVEPAAGAVSARMMHPRISSQTLGSIVPASRSTPRRGAQSCAWWVDDPESSANA
jgi:regulator of RNase E activity RraA